MVHHPYHALQQKKKQDSLTDTTTNSQSTVITVATLRFLFTRTSRLSQLTYHGTAIAATATWRRQYPLHHSSALSAWPTAEAFM